MNNEENNQSRVEPLDAGSARPGSTAEQPPGDALAAELTNPPCARCGGPHPFDTSLPSVRWNAVIRANGLPDYLCATCILRAFVSRGESFTATLWGAEFTGEAIRMRVKATRLHRSDRCVVLRTGGTLYLSLTGVGFLKFTAAEQRLFNGVMEAIEAYERESLALNSASVRAGASPGASHPPEKS